MRGGGVAPSAYRVGVLADERAALDAEPGETVAS